MSRTRIVIRVVLGVLLLGMLGVVGNVWLGRSTGPLAQADRAISAGNLDQAKIHLLNLLQEEPENSAGHLALAQVLLSEEKTRRPQASYSDTAKALFHYESAAKMDEANLDLQKDLLTIYLTRRQPDKAATVASRIFALEPNNANAHFALTWKLVSEKRASEEDREQARKRLEQLLTLADRPKFQSATLAIQHYESENAVDERNDILSAVVEDSMALSGEQLSAISPEEHRAMNRLLKYAILMSTSVEELNERLAGAIKTCETLAETSADSGSLAADLLFGSASNEVWQSASKQQLAFRSKVEQRGRTLIEQSLSEGSTNARAYHWLALDTHRKNAAGAIEILEKGIIACAGKANVPVAHDLHMLAAEYLIETREFSRARQILTAVKDAKAKDQDKTDGRRELLEGRIASMEGRQTAALHHFVVARTHLGESPLLHALLADTLLHLGRWNEALPYLGSLRDTFAASSDSSKLAPTPFGFSPQSVQWKMAQCYMTLGRWDEAQPILTGLASTQFAPKVISALAIRDAQQGRLPKAFVRLAKAHEEHPTDLVLLKTHAQLLLQSGQAELADSLLEAAAAKPEATKENLALLIRWHLGRKHGQRALGLVDQLERDYSGDSTTIALKAEVYLRTGKSDELLALTELLRRDPEMVEFASLLSAAAEFRGNDLNEALAQLNDIETPNQFGDLLRGEIALRQSDHTTAISSLSSLLDVTAYRQRVGRAILQSVLQIAQKESPGRAEELVDEMLEDHPDDFFLIVAKAEMNFTQGRFDDGIASLENLERQFPALPTAAQIKAVAWLRRNRLDRATTEIERALALSPNDFTSNRLAAEIFLASRKYRRVLEHAKAALTAAPNQWGIFLIQAEALRRSGDPKGALEVIRWLVDQQPTLFIAHKALISNLKSNGQLEDALAACRAARKSIPKASQLAAEEISLLCHLKRLDDATELAARYESQHADAPSLLLLARAFASARQFGKAQELGQKLLQDTSDEVRLQTHVMLGDIALLEHQRQDDRKLLDSARDHFTAALARRPNHLSAANNLGWLLATEFSNARQAIAVLERAKADRPINTLPVEFIDTLAVAYELGDQRGRAQKLLEAALSERGDPPALLFRYAIHLSIGTDVASAKAMLTRCLDLPLPDAQLVEVRRTLAELSRAGDTNSDASTTLSAGSPE